MSERLPWNLRVGIRYSETIVEVAGAIFGGEEAMSGDGQPAPVPGQEVAEFLGLCSVLRLSNE